MIAFEHVEKTYVGRRGEEVQALVDVSFRAEDGEFVAIVGPSGCGKSTLLKATAGVVPVTGGAILVDGVDATHGAVPAGRVGMVFQSPVLLQWRDVLGNVVFPVEVLGADVRQATERAKGLIRLVGLAGFERRYPRELSGGMQQRVAISRALVFDPPYLLMDEPFGALDALTRAEMNVELLRITEPSGKTVLLVTHSITEAVLLSDKVVVMTPRPGRVARVMSIELPRPRTLEMRFDARFAGYAEDIRQEITGH